SSDLESGVDKIINRRMLCFPCRFPDIASKYRCHTRLREIVTVAPKSIKIQLAVVRMINLVRGKLIIIPIPCTYALVVDKILKCNVRIKILCDKPVKRGRNSLG